MALVQCNFHSSVLDQATTMMVILPEPAPPLLLRPSARKIPTLYLLRGLSDDQTIWQRRTSLERYVQGWNLAVVMPGTANPSWIGCPCAG